MSAQIPQLEGGRRPVNRVRIATWITAGLVGLANTLTLSGIIPVEIGTQVCVGSTIIVPILLGLASIKKTESSPLFDEAVSEGNARRVKHSNLTGKTQVEYGDWTEAERKKADRLAKKLK